MAISDSIQLLSEKLSNARHVTVITGAGVSAESGLRTFRETMEGLWKEFDPKTLATPEAFEANPELVTRWYDGRRLGCLAAEPNPGHIALARIEREISSRGGRFTLLTQNVDRLHQKAGSSNVVELHGSIIEWRCNATGRKIVPPESAFTSFPPRSPFADSILRPDVVWFGEMLPEDAILAAGWAAANCDLFISIGTSAVVYPAAAYLEQASANGAFTAEINKDTTPATGRVNVAIQARSGEALPRLADLAFGADKQ